MNFEDTENKELSCADKLSFDTKQLAENSAVVARYQHGTKLKAYKCKACSLWHLTSDYDN